MKYNCIPFVLLLCIHYVCAIDLGFSPTYYRHGDKVDLIVNKVESDNTQLPYSYRDLPFVCPPDKPVDLSLGEILRGDRLWKSQYDLKFGVDMPCMRLCDLISKESGMLKADTLIKNGYVVHWLVDGLPGATTFVSGNRNNKYYAAGFPLGFTKDKISYIYNHVMIVIRYHRDPTNTRLNSIVGFEVYPKSVSNEECPGSSKNYDNFAVTFERDSNQQIMPQKTVIPYTYAVYWREDNTIDYNSRWDLYYENETTSDHQIHWFSFINSMVLLFLVSLIVAVVLLRVLKSDIQANSPSLPTNQYDAAINSSWKNLSDDITKRPNFPLFLSALVASGMQLIIATIGVIVIFVINSKFSIGSSSFSSNMFFNNHQGAFFSISLTFFVVSGVIPSFCGIILHKIFNNDYLNSEYNKTKTFISSILFSGFLPSLILSIVLFLNFFVWAKHASTALPFGTIIVLLLVFFVIELPLGIIGGYYGNKYKFDNKSFLLANSGDKRENDDKNFKAKKKTSWLLNPSFSVLIFGLIPFGIVYVELLFIFNSVWLEKTTFYYMYGFLLLTAIILIVIIAESTIIATYISIAVYNNPNWQWLSFNVGSSIGWYILGYSIYYFIFYLNVNDFVSALLYFAYMALTSCLIGVACGSVGTLTGLLFIRKIYGSIKVD